MGNSKRSLKNGLEKMFHLNKLTDPRAAGVFLVKIKKRTADNGFQHK